ncbi:ankyrin [Pholiota conissans]|uniref:Ankyrin n=1 Tax=Pholiota conissans TaxID=109636 RepID=A0A9P6CYB8_9AGAR|nr:ankyrin [Pholiota conissans]
MAEKDATARLRRAVKENNLFLVKRLIQRTDMRNPDTSPKRYTSLAWAAVLGHEETFEFLLATGHDDEELSKDSENNTILMLLADQILPSSSSYVSAEAEDNTGAYLRMARLYYERYPWVLDWSNIYGKTALHIGALKGNEELVRMLCDLGADYDLSDNKGNTPLHYASSWGHIPTVQLLIERGCQYSARNNEGFTASDYAYSFTTRETLQETARAQFEINKKQRRNIFAQAAQAASRGGNDWGSSPVQIPNAPPVPAKDRSISSRLRSGSGTSRTTATSDSGEPDHLYTGHLSSSPSQPSTGSSSGFFGQPNSSHHGSSFVPPAGTSKGSSLAAPANPASALSPIANRMRERDADAMEKYMNRNRSGSQGTASTDTKSINGTTFASAGPSSNGDDITALMSGTITPRRLRPSVSAAQLRTQVTSSSTPGSVTPQPETRLRSGTSPSNIRGVPSPLLERSSSISKSLRSIASVDRMSFDDSESYIGPPSQYAQFPEPPQGNGFNGDSANTTPTNGRRKAFHILSKPMQTFDTSSSSSHRRGMSATSARGS